MTPPGARHVVLGLAGAALVWTAAVAVTGGFVINTGWMRVSSRDWLRPFLVSAAFAVLYVIRYRHSWRSDLRMLTTVNWAPVVAGLCAATAFTIGVGWGTFIGGGPDASGYVSQADMWTRGALTMNAPEWVRDARWNHAAWSSAPVGYRPRPETSTIVPVYSPGLPIMMALFQTIGGRHAVFYVVPLLGVLAVWATFLLGRHLAGPWTGAIAAALLLSSPVFLWFLVQPMSDVAVTACWAVALLYAWKGGRRAAVAAGLATAAAILVRPNLVPLAALLAVLVAMVPRDRLQRLVLFSVAAAPGPLMIAVLNWYWHGSPTRSGYGSLDELYAAANVGPNLERYAAWLLDTQTPFILLGAAAPIVLRGTTMERARLAVLSCAYPLSVLSLYLTYMPFDQWYYLRFLLPALPAMTASAAAVLVQVAARSRPRAIATAVVVAIVAAVVFHGWNFATREGVFRYRAGDQRFARAVSYANTLPSNAILLTLGYSGTLRFYTGRDVLRWEVIDPSQLDEAVTYLRERSHPIYFIGDSFEADEFKRRFSRTRLVETFDDRFLLQSGYGFVVYDLSGD